MGTSIDGENSPQESLKTMDQGYWSLPSKLGGGVKYFWFSSLYGEMILEEHIFQLGSNHQLDSHYNPNNL